MADIEKIIDEVSRKYEDIALLRVAVVGIPFIGGSLDLLISSFGQEYITKRLEDFINELHVRVANIEEDKIDKSFLESE